MNRSMKQNMKHNSNLHFCKAGGGGRGRVIAIKLVRCPGISVNLPVYWRIGEVVNKIFTPTNSRGD